MSTQNDDKPYGLGIALSGGGARGFAHAGALKAFEEAGIRPEVIAGVSAGSVVSVLYAGGLDPEKMIEIFADKKFSDFCEVKFRKSSGLFSLSRFKRFIMKQLNGIENLEDLRIPTYIGATDFDQGVAVEFHTGPIGERVIASCSIPIVFRPVKIDGTYYVDGGVLRNLPVWTIRKQCRRVIAVNCSPLSAYKYSNSIIDTTLRTFQLMAKTNTLPDMAMADLAVKTPDIAGYNVFNLRDIRKVYISGYAAAHKALSQCTWLDEFRQSQPLPPSDLKTNNEPQKP